MKSILDADFTVGSRYGVDNVDIDAARSDEYADGLLVPSLTPDAE